MLASQKRKNFYKVMIFFIIKLLNQLIISGSKVNEEREIQINNQLKSDNSLWQELKDAIRGSEADYTEIKIGKAIFFLQSR
ncbi:MAG: hypothetical protein MZV64_72175 [Ignavibacteriales bacterium]|nr:hypothetical protein [Ignavibacteriales bacterium]